MKPVRFRLRLRLALLALSALLGGATRSSADVLNPGDILVGDINVPAIFDVNPTTGNRTIFSGPSAGSGTAFVSPEGIAINGSGGVFVADSGVGALFGVDAATGNRTILSGAGTGTGTAFVLPFGVAIGAGGNIYVADAGDAAGDGFILRVNPLTGARILISGQGVGSGDAFGNIRGIAVGSDGSLIVTDLANQAIYRVDPTTGLRTILSDATHGTGLALMAPEGVTIDRNGKILVADAGDASILQIDPLTGNRTLISGGLTGAGSAFSLPMGVTLNASGQILVGDSGDLSIPTLPAVFTVDPTSGNRTDLSDFAHGSGPAFQNFDLGIAVYVAAVPEPSSLALLALGAAALLCSARRAGSSS
jgi:sugar lactone lactonase YvrE